MTSPHKHADLIKAWADGAEIEQLTKSSLYISWGTCEHPHWYEQEVYRIKPEIKPNVVAWIGLTSLGVIGNLGSVRPAVMCSSWVSILRIEINHNDPDNLVLVSATLEKP